jgi:hypothetical protein
MKPYEIIALLNKQVENDAKRIEELEAMLRTILSIPAVGDIEKRIAEFANGHNPITDARAMV